MITDKVHPNTRTTVRYKRTDKGFKIIKEKHNPKVTGDMRRKSCNRPQAIPVSPKSKSSNQCTRPSPLKLVITEKPQPEKR